MKHPEDKMTLELQLPNGGGSPAVPQAAEAASPAAEMFVPAPDWSRALQAAVQACPTGKKGVAELLGVSRPLVSRVMNGSLPASAAFVDRVAMHLMQVPCPYLQRPIPPQDCHTYSQRTYAQVNQFEVEHWRACRSCPHNRSRVAARLAQPGTAAAQEVAP